jgi:hypothetical protein
MDIYDPLLDAINLRRRTQPLTPFARRAGTRAKLRAILMPPDVGTPTSCSACHKEEMQTLVAAIEKTTPVAPAEDLGAAITRTRQQR